MRICTHHGDAVLGLLADALAATDAKHGATLDDRKQAWDTWAALVTGCAVPMTGSRYSE